MHNVMNYTILVILYSALMMMYLLLTYNVIIQRRTEKQAVNSKDAQVGLTRAIRAQANFLENTQLFLVGFLLLSFWERTYWWLVVLGGMFLVGRLCHALSLIKYELAEKPSYKFRILGMKLSFLSSIILMGRLLSFFIMHYAKVWF